MPEDSERPKEEELLDDPSGGPAAKSASDQSQGEEDLDPSAGAGGQDDGDQEPEGAVEDAAEETGGSKPAPG